MITITRLRPLECHRECSQMLANAILTSAASAEREEGAKVPARGYAKVSALVSQGKVHRRRGTRRSLSIGRASEARLMKATCARAPSVAINVEGVADAPRVTRSGWKTRKICMLAPAWSPEAESKRPRSSFASPFRSRLTDRGDDNANNDLITCINGDATTRGSAVIGFNCLGKSVADCPRQIDKLAPPLGGQFPIAIYLFMGHRCKVRIPITRLGHARTANAKGARENTSERQSKRARAPSYRFAFPLFFSLSLSLFPTHPPILLSIGIYVAWTLGFRGGSRASFCLRGRQFSEPLKFAEACNRFARNRVLSEFARARGFELARAKERDRDREREREREGGR